MLFLFQADYNFLGKLDKLKKCQYGNGCDKQMGVIVKEGRNFINERDKFWNNIK